MHPIASLHISHLTSPNVSGSKLNDSVLPPYHYSCLLVQFAHWSPVPVALSDNICVPGRSEVLVSCRVPSSSREQLGMVSPTSNNLTLPSSILAAYSVCQVQGRNLPVRIMNTSNIDIELHAGQKVSEFCTVLDTPDTYECMASTTELSSLPNNPSLSVIKQQLEDSLSSDLCPNDRKTILDTLLQFTNVIQHTIDTGKNPPIRQHPRRLPYAYRAETRNQVQDMLNQGVIQSSCSQRASPIVLVKRKDGSYRFCVDYRKLNSITKKDAHPLPRVDDLLNALHGSCLFSTLNIYCLFSSCYWQVSLDPNDREKTAFVTPDGLWEFCRLPFGVTGGCATFQ